MCGCTEAPVNVFLFGGLTALMVLALAGSAYVTTIAYSKIYDIWKDRALWCKWRRVLALIGDGSYQWCTMRAVAERAVPEFQKAKREGLDDTMAFSKAFGIGFKVLGSRVNWWRTQGFKRAIVPDPGLDIRFAEDEERRKLSTELKITRAGHEQSRIIATKALDIADEREDMVIFLLNKERVRTGTEPLTILCLGEALDEVRARMSRDRKDEGLDRSKAEDLIIEAGRVCQFVDQLHHRGIEPPEAFYALQRRLRAITLRPDPRKKK